MISQWVGTGKDEGEGFEARRGTTMEVLMDSYGSQDFGLQSWMDQFDSVVNPLDQGINQPANPLSFMDANFGTYEHSPSNGSPSSFIDASNGQSPADSVYGDTSDSGPIVTSDFSGFNIHQPWFDDSGNLLSMFPAPGAEKSSGFSNGASALQSFSEPQRPQHLQQQKQQAQQQQRQLQVGLSGTEQQQQVGLSGAFVSTSQRPLNTTNNNITSPNFGVVPLLPQQIRSNTLNWTIQPQQQQQQQPAPQPSRPSPPADPEPEDPGLKLVHLLITCAQAMSRGDLNAADSGVHKINQAVSLASKQQQAGPMTRVAAHFAEALHRRIFGQSSPSIVFRAKVTAAGLKPDPVTEYVHFYEICPYLKFAHFTANQALLEAFQGAKHVHVIDFNFEQGLQWPALLQALALREGGPPTVRLTGIGPPEPEGIDSLQQIGMDMKYLAEKLNIRFQFRGVKAATLDEVQPWMLQTLEGEVVAVNSMFALHKLLYRDGTTQRAGIDAVFKLIKTIQPRPKILTVSEQEANHNTPGFLDRFLEALHFYSSMFDSLEGCNNKNSFQGGASGSNVHRDQRRAEMYLGREICNVVACEGPARVERHETVGNWRMRLRSAGFQQRSMSENAFVQSSMLLSRYSEQGFRVEDQQGVLTLCWDRRPLLASSAWVLN